MSSGSQAYEEMLPAYAEGQSAYREAPLVVDASAHAPASVDRGKDWPLVFAIFAPVLAAYGAIGYGVYLAASAVL